MREEALCDLVGWVPLKRSHDIAISTSRSLAAGTLVTAGPRCEGGAIVYQRRQQLETREPSTQDRVKLYGLVSISICVAVAALHVQKVRTQSESSTSRRLLSETR